MGLNIFVLGRIGGVLGREDFVGLVLVRERGLLLIGVRLVLEDWLHLLNLLFLLGDVLHSARATDLC